jgi:hypothetical protein
MKKLFFLFLVTGIVIAFIGCSTRHDVNGPTNSLERRAAVNIPLWGEGDLGDFVWLDVNCNGIQDEGEIGMPDVEVTLYNCQDSMIESMQTDSTGHYLFEEILPGQYYVHFDLPPGYMFSPMDQGDNDSLDSDVNPETGNTDCITQDSAEVDLTVDAGLCREQQEEGCLGDFVWKDMNCNGIQDEGEPGIDDITVKLYRCDDSSLVEQVETNEQGYYIFDNLAADDYFIHFVLPEGFTFSPMDQGDNDAVDSDADTMTGNTVCITLEAAECDSTWDAGMCRVEEEGCTRSKGYWKTHAGFGPQEDVVTPLLPIWLGLPDSTKSLDVTTAQIAHDVLVMFTYGRPSNGITKLYAQLLAAKLNIADGASDEDIAETIEMADTFLAAYDWNDWSMLSGEQRQMVLSWMERLDSYNEGYIGPGSCDENEYHDGGDHDFDK